MQRFPFYLLLIFCLSRISGQTQFDSTALIQVDTTAPVARTWILTGDFMIEEEYELDTNQTSFQIYHPVYKYSVSASFLGNLGLHTKTNIFFQRDPDPDYLFLKPFVPYLYSCENNVFYNVRKPFSILEYSTTGQNRLKRQETFHAIHTQNINPFINFGFDIRLASSEGQYANQKARYTNFSLFGSCKKEKYSLHTSLHLNSFQTTENGGLLDDSLFIETNEDEKTYDVNLSDARSLVRNLGFQLTQRYRFGKEETLEDTMTVTGVRRLKERTAKTGSVAHTIQYTRNKRIYEDGTSALGFYEYFYNNSTQSYDSTYYRSIVNTIQILLDENPNRKADFGARAFVSHELVKYAYNTPDDTLFNNGDTLIHNHKTNQYNNIYAGASVYHTVGKGWNWVFTGKYYLAGYKSGDLILNGKIIKLLKTGKEPSRIILSGSLTTKETDYFYQHFASNHFRWENSFNKCKEIMLSCGYADREHRFKTGVHLSLLTDYIYLNDQALPSQFRGGLTVISANVFKHFIAGPFHSAHNFHYQYSNKREIIRLPDISYYTSNFFGFTLVRNVLTAQVGFDVYYHTKYYGYAFMPATGFFYNQDIKKLGNYPYLDLFITAKLKRTRFYVKLDHAYAGFIPKNYFTVYRYPMEGRSFKFGLSWMFYN